MFKKIGKLILLKKKLKRYKVLTIYDIRFLLKYCVK